MGGGGGGGYTHGGLYIGGGGGAYTRGGIHGGNISISRLGESYSCQLIFARNKIVHDITIPHDELEAALLNVSTGHIVHASLKERHKKCWKITDSQVILHWVNSNKAALKPWVRNRLVEITRLSERSNWYFAKSKDMVVDLWKRKGITIDQVQPGSPWIDGFPWMQESAETSLCNRLPI